MVADLAAPARNAAHRGWAKAAFLLVAVGAATTLAWNTNLAVWLSPERVQTFLEGLGPWAPAVYVGMMALAVVASPIPSLPLDLAAGAAFGPFTGGVLSVLGAEIGAVIGFSIARALGRDAIARLLGANLAFCDQCARRQLATVIFVARLLPVFSFDLVSYGAGLTAIPLRSFALATLLGMIPPTFALTYFGSGMFSGAPWTWVLAAVLALSFFLVPIWIRKRNPLGLYDRMTRQVDPSGDGGSTA